MDLEIKYDRDEYFSRIELLMNFIRMDEGEGQYRQRLTSLVIIDLVTSFEVFCERSVRQFLKKFNRIELTTCKIDDRLRLEQSKKLISELVDLINHEHKENDSKSKLEKLMRLWGDGNKYPLDYKPKLPKGKHGEIHIGKLFTSIGVLNIFDSIKIESQEQSLLDDVTLLDVQGFIRDITEKRNIAIHEGAPLHDRVSDEMLERYCTYMSELIDGLVIRLNDELNVHKALSEAS